jgi:hypothetical protein
LVLWCSWLSLLSNTQAVPGSSPGGIIVFAIFCHPFLSTKNAGGLCFDGAEFLRNVGQVQRGFLVFATPTLSALASVTLLRTCG